MVTPDREDIHIISRHSNLSPASVHSALQQSVYNGKTAWQIFLKLLFQGMGTGFLLAGLIFFFAWNWDNLHKFVKLGIIEFLIIACTLTAVLTRKNLLIRKLMITIAAVLAGILFAVFGQVYQTGADSYELFRNWTACILLFVIATEFAPLWLIWIALVNITTILWFGQQTYYKLELNVFFCLFLINAIFLVGSLLLKHLRNVPIPHWFVIVLTLAAATTATLGICMGIFDATYSSFAFLLLAVAMSYIAAVIYSLRYQSLFFLAVTGCSTIIMISAAILRQSDSSGSILSICIFLAASITLLIKLLLNLQKQWNDEKAA